MASLSLACWRPGDAAPPAWAPVQAPAALPAPGPDAVLLLKARLDHPPPPGETDRYLRLLDPAERERHDRFRVDLARRRFLVGRGLVRAVLGQCLQQPPGDVPLVAGPQGKPALDPARVPDPVQFNLSHSGDLVLVGFTRRGPVGVDVEQARPRMLTAEIMARQFHPAEREAVTGDPDFFQCWALKEAVVKALGQGLGYPTARFSVAPLLHGDREQVLDLDGRAWRCRRLPIDDGYAAAVALAEP